MKKGGAQSRRPALDGGDKGVRTPDLMTASHALSQLSYIPEVVGDAGFEPATPSV